jgi:hypothetical protein
MDAITHRKRVTCVPEMRSSITDRLPECAGCFQPDVARELAEYVEMWTGFMRVS